MAEHASARADGAEASARQTPEGQSAAEGAAGSWTVSMLIADSESSAGGPRMSREEFLTGLRADLQTMVDQELGSLGWTGQDCPWIDWYIDRYRSLPLAQWQGLADRWLQAGPQHDAHALRRAVVERARRGVIAWRRRGESPLLPVAVGEEATAPRVLRWALPGAGPVDRNAARVAAELGPGEPLPSSVAQRYATDLGADARDVRLHRDARAASVASSLQARAFAVGDHVAFGAGQYRPGTPEGDAILAHELAHVTQQRSDAHQRTGRVESDDAALERDADRVAGAASSRLWGGNPIERLQPRARSGLRLSRCDVYQGDNPEFERQKIEMALRTRDVVHVRAIMDFTQATPEERRELIEILLSGGQGPPDLIPGGLNRTQHVLGDIWGAYGDELLEVLEDDAQWELWVRSVDIAPQLIELPPIARQMERFRSDTRALARGYLETNRQFARGELEAVGISPTTHRRTAIGELGESQAARLEELQTVALDVVQAQAAMEGLREIPVGWRARSMDAHTDYVPARFDPLLRPQYDHRGVGRLVAEEADTVPEDVVRRTRPQPTPWADVKAQYDRLERMIAELANAYPGIFALVAADRVEEAALGSDPAQAQRALGESLRELVAKMDDAEERIDSGDIDDRDLRPIHERLFSDAASSPSGTDWTTRRNRWIGERVLFEYEAEEFWTKLGLGTLAAAAFVVAEIATFGTATFFIAAGIGLAATGAGVAMSWEHYDDLRDAAAATTSTERSVVSQGQADAALAEALLDSIFGFIDAATLGASSVTRRAAQVAGREAVEQGARETLEGGTREATERAGRRAEGRPATAAEPERPPAPAEPERPPAAAAEPERPPATPEPERPPATTEPERPPAAEPEAPVPRPAAGAEGTEATARQGAAAAADDIPQDVRALVGEPFDAANLPPEYYTVTRRGRTFIARRPSRGREVPRLFVDYTTDPPVVRINPRQAASASRRISRPGALRNNLGAPPGPGHQAHHVVPDQVVRDHDLFRAARDRAGYDVDRARNGQYLAETEADAVVGVTDELPLHRGSHRTYSDLASQEADREVARLLRRFESLDDVPEGELLDAAGRVEDRMRARLRNWRTTHGERLQ